VRRVAKMVPHCDGTLTKHRAAGLTQKLDLEDEASRCRVQLQLIVDRQWRVTWGLLAVPRVPKSVPVRDGFTASKRMPR